MSELLATTRSGTQAALAPSVLGAFRSRLRGKALRPGDPGYDDARKVWNGMVDKRPALLVRCADARDVAAAVGFAREHDLLASVRGGGHNIAGKSLCDGGLTIDLSPMRAVTIDRKKRVARVEGGALLGDLDRAAQAVGLATTAGVVTHTGVGGLTLGGGVGRLARKHGLACDNVISFELVAADGKALRASAEENPDLFWGLRGGGGNFGVVTAFEFRLHPVGPQVLGGKVVHKLEDARQVLSFYGEFARSAPEELGTDAIFLTTPDGVRVLALAVCYLGTVEAGEKVLRPLRQFGTPVVDDIAPMPYLEVQAAADAFFPIGPRFYWKSHFLKEITPQMAELTVEHFGKVRAPGSLLVFQQFGGAVGRVGQADTAFWHRDVQWDNFPVSVWTDPADSPRQMEWVREWWDAMRPYSAGGEYVNNFGEEGDDRVRAAYGGNYGRLGALKKRYDPTNFFRLNANVHPAP